MAEAVLGPAVEVLVGKLIAVASQEIGFVFGVENELKKLRESLMMIQAVLDDASKRQVQEDQSVQRWLKNLEDVAYESDNLLDEIHYENLRRKIEIRNQMKRQICFCFSSFNPHLISRSKTAHKIKELNEKLKKINDEATNYGLQKRAREVPLALPRVVETDSITVDPIVLGRDGDVSNIIHMLVDTPTDEVVSVIPIIGMGGLGKTTLARQVFHRQDTIKHFDKRIWVCVSENFNANSIFKRILESLGGTSDESSREGCAISLPSHNWFYGILKH